MNEQHKEYDKIDHDKMDHDKMNNDKMDHDKIEYDKMLNMISNVKYHGISKVKNVAKKIVRIIVEYTNMRFA